MANVREQDRIAGRTEVEATIYSRDNRGPGRASAARTVHSAADDARGGNLRDVDRPSSIAVRSLENAGRSDWLWPISGGLVRSRGRPLAFLPRSDLRDDSPGWCRMARTSPATHRCP